VTTASGGGTGTFSVAATGTSGALAHSAAAGLTVQAAPVQVSGDFTLLISPSNQTVPVGDQGVPYTVTVASPNGYTGNVYLLLTNVSTPCIDIPYFPSGAIAVGAPAPFSVSVGCGAGSVASFTVQGNLGNSVYHSVTATINIGPAEGITITSSAASLPSVPAPGSVSYTVQVSPVNGFTGTVQLTASGMPTGTSGPSTGTFAPASLTFSGSNTPQTTTLTVNTAAGSPAGTYAITIVGVSGNLGNYATASLVISGTPQPTNLDQMAVLSMLVLRHEALVGPNAPTDNGGLYGLPPGDAATVNGAVDAASQQLNQLAAQTPSFTDGTANMNAQNGILQNLNQQLHTQIAASSAQVMDAYMNGFISPQLARYSLDSASGTAQAASSCGYISQMYQNDCLEVWNEINFFSAGGSNSGLGRVVLSTVQGPDQSSFCAYVSGISETFPAGGTSRTPLLDQKLCWNFVDPKNPAVLRAAAWVDTESRPVRGTYTQEGYHKFELYKANPNGGSPILVWTIPSGTASFDNLNPLPTPSAPTVASWTIGSNGDDKYSTNVDLQFTVSGVLNPDGTPRLISNTWPVTTVTVPDCSAEVSVVLSPLPTGNEAPRVSWSGGGVEWSNLHSDFDLNNCWPGKSITFKASVGLNDSLSASVTVVVQAPTPDFTVSGPGSPVAVAAGGSAAYTVTVTPVNGFTGTVSLAPAAGLPQFASASVSPASLTFTSNQAQQATVTVTTMACTPAGTAAVTAASGSLSHSSSSTLAVTNSGLPVVCGMSPTAGSVGTAVTLSGLNFGAMAAAISVSFGGVAATGVSVNSSGTSIQATVPAVGASGNVSVLVTVNGVAAAWNGGAGSFPTFGFSSVQLQTSPSDVTVSLGDLFTITASGTPVAGGSYAWQIVGSQGGDAPGAFVFVSQPSCPGSSSCTATIQATGTGFAAVQVTFQGATAPPVRVRSIAVLNITQIWSDQFPGGPIANYLPGGAGLVGNNRQLMIMGTRSDSVGYLKANIVTEPNNQEAWNHVLVRLQQGTPLEYPPAPNPNSPTGTCSAGPACVVGSVLSVSTLELVGDTDYSVVAGVDRWGGGQASGTLFPQEVQFTFFQPCIVNGVELDNPASFFPYPPCSGGAVRIVSRAAYYAYQAAAVAGAAIFGPLYNYPTAKSFLMAFALPGAPGGGSMGAPSPNLVSSVSPQQLYFNTGVTFPSLGPTLIPDYEFTSATGLSNHIFLNQDFQTLITDTLTLHNQDVLDYFSNNLGVISHTFPAWVVIGGCSQRAARLAGAAPCTAASEFTADPVVEADLPPLFPCQSMPGVECDLTFNQETDPDLFNAFGRVGYQLSVTATVSLSVIGAPVYKLDAVAVTGFIYDYYQFNPTQAVSDYYAADLQSGYTAPGDGGQVYRSGVNVYGALAIGFTFQ
jgi:hypothetical protein